MVGWGEASRTFAPETIGEPRARSPLAHLLCYRGILAAVSGNRDHIVSTKATEKLLDADHSLSSLPRDRLGWATLLVGCFSPRSANARPVAITLMLLGTLADPASIRRYLDRQDYWYCACRGLILSTTFGYGR